MGYIYKITNIVNNKIYIGQTIRDIQSRWNQHINNAYNENDKNNHFHNAILKYGENSFSIVIIEECPDEVLNEREKYWINYYDSYNNGYNSTLGGEGYQKYTITTEEVGKMWDSGLSMSDIAKKLSVSRTVIKSRLELYENYSKEQSIQRGIKNSTIKKYQPVYQWSDVGIFVEYFESGKEAEQKTGFSHSAISQAINKKCLSNGYYWTHGEKPSCKNRIAQYDLQNNFIRYWRDAATAGREIGCDSSGISKCCNGKRKTCNGFMWKKE